MLKRDNTYMKFKIFRDNSTSDTTASYPLEIKPHDGLYPLLRFPYLCKGPFNPYFGYLPSYSRARIAGHIRLATVGHTHKYRIRRRGVVTFYSGYYSVMGIPTSLDYLPSSLAGDKFKMYGEPDIFCLAVINTSKIPDIEFTTKFNDGRYRYSKTMHTTQVELNTEDITILVSKEKLRKAKYSKENYSITARNEILFSLRRLALDFKGIKCLDVSDEYLRNFYSMPEGIRTNSLVETMRIESEIKDSVFSNLNSIAV